MRKEKRYKGIIAMIVAALTLALAGCGQRKGEDKIIKWLPGDIDEFRE